MIISRRSFTLLEVLIAFFLIMIAMIPLIAPYPYIYKQERHFIDELEINRKASELFVDFLAKLYRKEVNFSSLRAGQKETVEIDSKLPYKAYYYIRFKDEHQQLKLYQVIFQFEPNDKANKVLKFKYDLLVNESI